MKRILNTLLLIVAISVFFSLTVFAGNDDIEIYENNKYTSTNITANDNDYQIVTEVFDKCIGNTIIVALYQDGRTEYVKSYLVDEDLTSITTTPDIAFDKVKVFVWGNCQTLKPVCSIYNTSISCERHAYTKEITPKGCSSNAIITYTCSVCGHTYDSLVPDINITVAQTSKQSIVTNGYVGYVREFKINVSGGYGTVLCKYEMFSNSTATTPAQTIDFATEYGLSLQYGGTYSSVNNYVLQITAKDDYGNVSKYRFVLGESNTIPYYISELEHSIVQIEHTVGTWEVTSEPTCTKQGVKTANCLECSGIITESIPANGHNYREVDDICNDCGELISYTNGLSYTLINNDTEYEVSGIGEATEEDIVIPRTYNGKPITQIGEEAFKNCKTIKSVRIPSGVKYIREWAFYYSSIKEIVIPSSVEVVESYAFSWCNNVIKKIEGVSYVGNWTVDCDESVSNVTLKDGTVGIGGDAFYNCSNLVNIDMPDSLNYINEDAFYNCSSLVNINIHNGIVSIGEYAFYKCTSLTSVTIPHSIKSVGNYAFSNCSNLSELNISGNITDIGSSVAYNCKKLEHITILDGSTQISKYLLKGFANAKTVTIPDSVTTICEYAFADNDSLTTITIPNGVRVIEKNAFYGCDNLNDIIILDGITSIGERVFYNCTGLKNIIIPDSVVTIGDDAFYDCSNLVSIVIPNNVTSIGMWAFYDCSNLTSVTIPNTVSSIGNYAFYNCTSLTDITIPGSITSVGRSIFYNCNNIKRISIADKSTEIAGWDFSKFTALTNITIPDSITKIDSSVSFNCATLSLISFSGTKAKWDAISKGNNSSLEKIKVCYIKNHFECCFTYSVTNNQITITSCDVNIAGDIEVPSKFNGYPVTAIGQSAFQNCNGLISITIPSSVKTLENYAFCDCKNLVSVIIPDGVTSIGGATFYGCINLIDIIIPPSVNSIGNSAFFLCNSLRNISIPNGVTKISNSAFGCCGRLEKIYIPSSVTKIETGAFLNGNNLAEIIFDGTIEQWMSIEKEEQWDLNTEDYVVYCVDGSVAK